MKVDAEIERNLTDYQGWNAGESEFGFLDYTCCVATPDLFFGFSELLVPELVEHEGEWFRAEKFDRKTHEDWKRALADPLAIQKVMNHIHLSTLFQDQVVADAVALAAARQLATIWSRVLADKGLVAEAYGDNLTDLEVTFFRRAAGG